MSDSPASDSPAFDSPAFDSSGPDSSARDSSAPHSSARQPQPSNPCTQDETSALSERSEVSGTWDDRHTTLRQLRELMQEFVRERQWEHFHNAKNLAMSLAIEAGELMEHFQWLTTDQVVASEGLDLPGIRDELADVLCYALSLANALDIDISQAIEQKMVKNRIKYPAP